MAETFDPYRKWLGIPPEEQPPNHYRLLGIGLFEADDDVIEGAADRQMAHIQRHQLGQYAGLSQKLLNELSAAKICLLKADRKEAYDRALRKQIAANAPAAPPAAPAVAAPAAVPRRQSPAQTVPADTAPADDENMDAVDPAPVSELPQERRPVGKRRQTTSQKSAARKSAAKKAGSKKTGSNPMIFGGAIAAGVAVLAIIGIVASRDKTPPKVEHAPAEHSSEASTVASKPASKPDQSPVAKPTDADQPEPAPEPSVAESPAEPPAAGDADTNVLASGDVADLLPLVKVNAKTKVGKWQKSNKGLTLLASNGAPAWIVLPFAPPNEYQLELVVEPQPEAELIVGLIAGGNQLAAILDGWGGSTSGLSQIDSAPGDANASTHQGRALTPRKPNVVLVSVRGDSIKVACDGKAIIDWHGPFDRLSLAPEQTVADKRALFLGGGSGTAFRIRSLRLATLSGKGQELTAPVVANPDVARVESEPEMPAEPAPAKPPSESQPPVAANPGGFELVGHTLPIRSIAVHSDSNQVVSACWAAPGDNQAIRTWNLAQRSQGPNPTWSARPNAVDFAREGDVVYVGFQAGDAFTQPFPNGQARVIFGTPEPIYCMSAGAAHDLLAAGGTGGLIVHSQVRRSLVFQWKNPVLAPVNAISLSADGERMWAGCGGTWTSESETADGKDFKLHLWDGPTRNYVELDGHKGSIWGIAASRDGSRVATASHDRTVRIWDAKTHKTLRTLSGHEGPVYAVAISPDGKLVLSGGADKTVRLWDAKTGRELNRFTGHTDIVRAVALTPNGKYALSGGNDKVLRVWELSAAARRPVAVAAKPEPATQRPAVPAKADIDEATKLIREVFADDFKQAKKPADKIALAEKLLKQAADSQTDPERYALLGEARSLAAAGGSPALAIQVIDQTSSRFEIDTAREIADLIEQLSKDTLPPAVRKELAEALLPIADDAVARSDYETARRLLAAATQSARKTNDNALIKQVTARVQEVNDAKKLFDAYRKAVDKIEESPDDPPANLAAGKYLCFVKQDWDKGLPHLAKGSDETLRQIAELELKAPTNPEDQVKLGDLWWALVEQAKGQEKAEYADRCDKWYGTALPGLKGLTQTKVSKRIEELAATHKPAAGPAATTTTAASERPASGDAGGTAATVKIIAKIKQAIRKEMLVRSTAIAGRSGNPFAEIPPGGAILAGFNYTTVPVENGGELSSIQAIYWTPKGTVNGERWGVENGPVKTVVAKKGYAVAGLRTGGSVYEIAWFEIVFAKLGATGLDMADKYSSQWTGNKYWSPITLGDNGQLVVGIFGTVNSSQAAGLGLVQLPDK